MKTAIALYVPALHKGFMELLIRNKEKSEIVFLVDEKLFKQTDPDLEWMFEKDLRAIPVIEMKKAITALEICNEVKILDENNLKEFDEVIIPDDDIVEKIMLNFYPSIKVIKDTYFIRWGKKTVLSQRTVVGNASISLDEFDKRVMLKGFSLAEKSSDWWRQVGVIIFPLNAKPIQSFNQHLPNQQAPYINGDPRTNFKPGQNTDLSTAIHAEANAIAYAARNGIALEGASMYVTTLPCPSCAWSIRQSGIKTVYYCDGYSLLGVVDVFESAGISLIFVDIPN